MICPYVFYSSKNDPVSTGSLPNEIDVGIISAGRLPRVIEDEGGSESHVRFANVEVQFEDNLVFDFLIVIVKMFES